MFRRTGYRFGENMRQGKKLERIPSPGYRQTVQYEWNALERLAALCRCRHLRQRTLSMATAACSYDDIAMELQNSSVGKRAESVKSVAILFADGADVYTDEQIALFGQVLGNLIENVETRTLVELSRSLAPLKRAPADIIRRLAHNDDIAVAGPVLSHSDQIAPEDLQKLARTRSQQHLLAISRRCQIDMSVADIVADRGDNEVVESLVTNPGASFSVEGFATLIHRSQDHDVLAEQIGSRADVPPNVLRAIVSRATDLVRSRILAIADPAAKAEVERVLADISRAVSRAPRDYSAAQRRISALHAQKQLTQPAIAGFATAGRIEDTVAALAMLCSVPIDIIDQLLYVDRVEALLVPCRAADLAWPTARAVIALGVAGRSLSKGDFDHVNGSYLRLQKSTAEKVLRYWLVRGPHADEAASRQKENSREQHPAVNRRKHVRRTVNLRVGFASYDGILIGQCTVVDVSGGGARLKTDSSVTLPDEFDLFLAANGETRRRCKVQWRSDHALGVQFLTRQETATK
jgi:uncharacterized protein (DUF2336 family)